MGGQSVSLDRGKPFTVSERGHTQDMTAERDSPRVPAQAEDHAFADMLEGIHRQTGRTGVIPSGWGRLD